VEDSTPDHPDLRSLLEALRRRWLLIAGCLAAFTGAALGLSLAATEQYSASASLLFRDPGFDQRLFGSSVFQATDPAREAATNLNLVSLGDVAERTAHDLGGGLTADDVTTAVNAEAQGQSDVISIIATDPDPELAARIANSFAKNYVDFRREADRQKVREARRLVEQDYAALSSASQQGEEGRSLQDQLSALRTLEALQTGNAELVQRAHVPSAPSSPKIARNTLLGASLGLILGIGLALLFARLDRRLRTSDDLADAFGFPVLSGIPRSKALANSDEPLLPAAEVEAFRMLRTRLRYFNVDRNIKTVLVTSASAQDGKTTIAWHFARSAAQAGMATLLIEADLHRPTVAERQGLAPLPGLTEFLSGQATLAKVIQPVRVDAQSNGSEAHRNLDVVVAGAMPPNPAQILESDEMKKLIEDLSERYDLVVVDTPPATLIADAIPLMAHVDGVIVIGQYGKTTRDEAAHLHDQLRRIGASVLGVVANRAPAGRGYSGYYGYGESAPRKNRVRRAILRR
jgi:receptor protein-tyrosine kinase